MFSKFIYNVSLIALVCCFLSCVREEIIPYHNNGQTKLVVIGFLSPGDRVDVYVGKSQPFGKSNYELSDFNEPSAIVTISNSRNEHQKLTFNGVGSSVFSCAQLDFAILPGETYTIKVQSSLSEVIAQTTVPSKAASWKQVQLSGPQEYSYYTFSGSWDQLIELPEANYGVSLRAANINIIDRINEGITMINGSYSVKRDVYLAQTSGVVATLLTRDKYLGEFSKKTDLTLDVIDNLNSAAFTDVISSFKGVIPNSGNIRGGIGVFGSYLKEIRTISK